MRAIETIPGEGTHSFECFTFENYVQECKSVGCTVIDLEGSPGLDEADTHAVLDFDGTMVASVHFAL